MKTKILPVITIFIFFISSANAQIKGLYMLGGNGFYSNSSSKTPSYGASIQLGKVVKDNFVIGVTGGYFRYAYPVDSTNSRQVNFGVFIRKYKSISGKFSFFFQPDATYSTYKTIANGLTSRFQNVTIGVTPGISYAISKCFQMELIMPDPVFISYMSQTYFDNSGQMLKIKNHVFSASVNLNQSLLTNFGLGFKFFIGKR